MVAGVRFLNRTPSHNSPSFPPKLVFTVFIPSLYRLLQFNRVSSTYGPLWMFFLNILLMLLDFVQLGSFAFLQNLTWGFPGIASSFFNVRYLGFLSGNFDTSFIVAVFLVVLFTIVMSVQEWIEWRHMTHPTSFSFTFLWAFVKFFTSMISRPLFLGILGTLLTAYDCQAVAGTEAASGGGTPALILTGIMCLVVGAPRTYPTSS